MSTICVSRKARMEICQPATARNVTLTSLIKVHWLLLVWFWAETRGKQTQAVLAQEDRGLLQARHFRRAETKMEQGGDYFIPFLMYLFQPDDEDSLKRQTPHLWRWFRIEQRLPNLPRQSTIKKAGMSPWYIDWVLAAELKSRVIGGRWTLMIKRLYCQEAVLCESCIPLQPHANWF